MYYSSIEGLKVYAEPSTSSKVEGALSLHEKVVRSRLERGYAYVESTKTGTKGWVNNAKLVWRLPAAPASGAPAATEAQPQPAAAEGDEPAATGTETLPTTVPEAPTTTTSTTVPDGIPPSILDAY